MKTNKRMKFVVLCSSVVFATSAVAFAVRGGIFTGDGGGSEYIASSDAAEAVSMSDVLTDNIAESIDAVSEYVSGFNMSDLTYEQYIEIESYIYFMTKNKLTDSEIQTVNRIIDKGTTVATISSAYDFYLTTSEDFSIIEDICALEDSYFGKYWIEDAYNAVTKSRHGVLNREDINRYLDSGLTYEDIRYANILCRGGEMTISEILDAKKDGASWQDITPTAVSVQSADNIKADIAVETVNAVSADENAVSPMTAYELSAMIARTGADIDIASVKADDAEEAIRSMREAYDEKLVDSVNETLKNLGLPASYMDYDEYNTYYSDNLNAAVENGLREQTFDELDARGYSPREIMIASMYFEGDEGNLIPLLKSIRKGDEIQ